MSRALLVEDNPGVMQATSLVLVDFGYFVCEVESAAAALQAVERHHFDLVLSDISLPGEMSGVGLAQNLRQKYPNLPIILATGFSDLVAEAQKQFIVLRKPYHIEELRMAIDIEVSQSQKSKPYH